MHKLESNGIRGSCLSLLESYLQNRLQSVHINKCSSSFLPITCGVPQGSILGPLMFNVYINDIVNTDTTVKYVIYADDSTILISDINLPHLISRANDVLSEISSWSKINRLKINPNKTKAVIFHAKNKIVPTHQPLILDSQQIDIVDTHKILGVYFSSNLSWDAHVNYLCRKISSVTGVVSRCRSLLPLKAKLQIYHALFNSHLNYCTLIWGTTTKRNINKILVLQKRIIRYVGNIERLGNTRKSFERFSIVRVDNVYSYRLLNTLYFSNRELSDFITALSCLERRVITVPTRNTHIWSIPRFRTTYKYQTLAYNVPTTLNTYENTTSCSKNSYVLSFVLLFASKRFSILKYLLYITYMLLANRLLKTLIFCSIFRVFV